MPFEDPVNLYSIIHFIEYGILALFPKVTTIHVLVISISWELLELILPYKWANESFLNKFADVLFNLSGFHFVRFLRQYI